MSNNLLTDQHITAEALMILENELTFTKQVNRDYQSEYKGPAKRGATVFAKKPPKYAVRDGQNIQVQDTTITQVPVTLNHQFGVDVEFSSQDLTLSIDGFSEQVLKPQIVQIANAIDLTGLQTLASNTANAVGTPGVTPGTGSTAQAALAVYSQAGALLDKTATPRDGNRAIVFNEDAQAITIPNLAGLMNPSSTVSDQYASGQMGKALGFKFGMDQNVAVATIGAQGGTPLVASVPTAATLPNGTTLSTSQATFAVATKGWTPSTQVLNAGDRVQFGNCYMVNPVSGQNAGKLKMFLVTSNVTSDGSGNATLQLAELMITAGAGPLRNPFQNVTALPAVNAPITVFGAANTVTPQNVAFHRDAITLACVDLPIPGGVHMAARKSDNKLGLSMRFVAAYNISTDQFIGRFDILCGWSMLRPEWSCVIAG